MTKEDALVILSYHSGRNEDLDNKRWINGFLGSLRPFQGKLHEQNFVEVMECLRTLSPDFVAGTISGQAIGDVFTIIYLGRRWTEEGSALDESNLINSEQQFKMDLWLDILEDALFYLLNEDPETAFLPYEKYRLNSGLLSIN